MSIIGKKIHFERIRNREEKGIILDKIDYFDNGIKLSDSKVVTMYLISLIGHRVDGYTCIINPNDIIKILE